MGITRYVANLCHRLTCFCHTTFNLSSAGLPLAGQFSYQDNADLHDGQPLPVHAQGHPPVGGGGAQAGKASVPGCVHVAVTVRTIGPGHPKYNLENL